MMAQLFRREYFIPRWQGSNSSIQIPAEPTDTWLGLLLNDRNQTPIGFLNVRTSPIEREAQEGVLAQFLGHMRLSLGSFKGELRVDGQAWATKRDGLRDFLFSMRSGEHATTVEGKVAAGRLTGFIATGGEKTPIDLPFPTDQIMTNAPGLGGVSMPSLEIGDEVLVDAFDPMTMSAGTARVLCLREETITVMGVEKRAKVLSTNLSGITSTAWVDANGEVLRAETPLGIVLQRMTQAEAQRLAMTDLGASDGLLKLASVPADGLTPRRGISRMRISVRGLDETADLPSDESQQVVDENELLIEPQGPDATAVTLESATLKDALANDIFLQLDNPRIVEAASRIVGNESDNWKKSQLIYEWVHASVKKAMVPSLPTALDVLTTLEGDCNEHTMLYTALARASGVPTRMAIGLVWSEEFDAFYYHAWPEVFVGRWVWMDPTLGQKVADATHIKLVNGDLQEWWKVAPYMGRLKLEVLEIE